MELFIEVLLAGKDALLEYLSAHVLLCLVPAFFIAGAMSVFLSPAAVLKYFGPKTPKWLSYSVASVSGTVLAVCSCTVLPLFSGIYRRGAGLGPACAFLFSGPAISVLAIIFTARILGFDIGIARAVGAILFSIAIGLLMAFFYRKEEAKRCQQAAAVPVAVASEGGRPIWKTGLFFAVLVAILVSASSQWWIPLGVLMAGLGIMLWRWFPRGELWQWMKETLHFVRLIFPWLLVGVFAAGIITALVPQDAVTTYVGGNGILANFIASFLGALMYFATLTEVPVIKSLMDLGMGNGPVLSLLLAGPALSLPSMLVLRNIIGTKKMLSYVGLVVIMATLTGYIYGLVR